MQRAETGFSTVKKILKFFYWAIPFKREIFSGIKILWIPPPGVYNYLSFKEKFRVTVADKYFFLNHGSDFETSIFWTGVTGGYEKRSMAVFMELCKHSRVILDIGANTGVYSLVAKAVNPDSKVYSFEPMKRVFNKLVANTQINNFDIACKEVAVSSYDGEAQMFDLPSSEHTYGGTVNKNLYSPDLAVVPLVVQAKKLSTIIKEENLSRVDLIKIDVESHEPEVLQGMGEYLKLMKPTILLEIWNDEIGRRVEELLQGLDYLFFSTDEVTPFRQENHIGNPRPNSGSWNYLVCSQQIADNLNLEHR
jgi:FkbM family methyltransferase